MSQWLWTALFQQKYRVTKQQCALKESLLDLQCIVLERMTVNFFSLQGNLTSTPRILVIEVFWWQDHLTQLPRGCPQRHHWSSQQPVSVSTSMFSSRTTVLFAAFQNVQFHFGSVNIPLCLFVFWLAGLQLSFKGCNLWFKLVVGRHCIRVVACQCSCLEPLLACHVFKLFSAGRKGLKDRRPFFNIWEFPV